MKYFALLLAAGAAAVNALTPINVDWTTEPSAQDNVNLDVNIPTMLQVLNAGEEFTFEWKSLSPADADKTVTIVLLWGKQDAMQPVAVLGKNVPNSGKFSWTPDASIYPPSEKDDKGKRYGAQLVIDSDGRYQWSNPFHLDNEDFPSPTATETETDTATTEPTEVPTTTPPSNSTTTPSTTKKSSTTTIITTDVPSNDTTTIRPTRTPTPTQGDDDEDDEAPPAETTTDAADSSAGRVVASFGMAGFLVAVLNLII